MLRTIHLYGSLADLAGTTNLELDVDTPVMLVNMLRSQVKGFRAWCNDNELGILLTDPELKQSTVDYQDFAMPFGDATDIHLLPKVEGSFTYAAFAAWAASYGVTATVVVAVAYVAVNLAISYALGAISQALAPSPDTSSGGGRAEERPSFLFNGPINVTEQGYAVPIVYGTHTTGSIVVSVGLYVEDTSYTPTTPAPPGQPANPPAESYQWRPANT